MNNFGRILAMLFPLAATCPNTFGQAAVEYGLGAGRAATTTAPALNLGNSIKGVFDTVNKTIEPNRGVSGSGSAARSSLSTTAKRTPRSGQSAGLAGKKSAPAEVTQSATQPTKAYEDPAQIRAGIEYDEMVRRFGPPSMSMTTEEGKRALSYSSQGGLVQVEVEGGKVVSVAGQASK